MHGVLDSVPTDEGFEVFGGEDVIEEWDKNDNEMLLTVIIPSFW